VRSNQDGKKRKKERNKAIVNEFKRTHPCATCGESRLPCLDFHHISGEKENSISILVDSHASIERLNAEIAKCIVLCSNCHRLIHFK
jgi:hypothetical protein